MDQNIKETFKDLEGHNRGFKKVIVFLVLVALFSFLVARTMREVRESRSLVPQKTISINGKGSLFAKPDIGQITLSIVVDKSTIAEAQTEATQKSNAVVEFLKAEGIEEKDFKTTQYSISPQYDFIKGRREPRGYEVRQSIDVKIRDLTKTGSIVARASELGANQIGNLVFTFDDRDELMLQARDEAIEDARMQAEKLEESLGITLGDIVSFYEMDGGYPPYYESRASFDGFGGEAISAPQIPVGENEIISRVTVVYEIR